MERARDVGRGVDDRPGFRLRPPGTEQAVLLPIGIPAGLDGARIEGLRQFAHRGALRRSAGGVPSRFHVMPAKAGIYSTAAWTPANAGVTVSAGPRARDPCLFSSQLRGPPLFPPFPRGVARVCPVH